MASDGITVGRIHRFTPEEKETREVVDLTTLLCDRKAPVCGATEDIFLSDTSIMTQVRADLLVTSLIRRLFTPSTSASPSIASFEISACFEIVAPVKRVVRSPSWLIHRQGVNKGCCGVVLEFLLHGDRHRRLSWSHVLLSATCIQNFQWCARIFIFSTYFTKTRAPYHHRP